MTARADYWVHCLAGTYAGSGPEAEFWIAAADAREALETIAQLAEQPFKTGDDGRLHLIDIAQVNEHPHDGPARSLAHFRRAPKELRLVQRDDAALAPATPPQRVAPRRAAPAQEIPGYYLG